MPTHPGGMLPGEAVRLEKHCRPSVHQGSPEGHPDFADSSGIGERVSEVAYPSRSWPPL
jgi:hypothetical protein